MSQVITAGTAESVGERVRSIRWGILALAVACAVAVFGAYGDSHPKANQEHAVPYICAVAAILAIGIFGFLVPAGLRGVANRPGLWSGWALALGILGVVIIPITFWSGVPLLIGTAAVLLGAAGRQAATAVGRGRWSRRAARCSARRWRSGSSTSSPGRARPARDWPSRS